MGTVPMFCALAVENGGCYPRYERIPVLGVVAYNRGKRGNGNGDRNQLISMSTMASGG